MSRSDRLPFLFLVPCSNCGHKNEPTKEVTFLTSVLHMGLALIGKQGDSSLLQQTVTNLLDKLSFSRDKPKTHDENPILPEQFEAPPSLPPISTSQPQESFAEPSTSTTTYEQTPSTSTGNSRSRSLSPTKLSNTSKGPQRFPDGKAQRKRVRHSSSGSEHSTPASNLDGKEIGVDDPTEITNVTTNPPPQTDYTPNNLPEILTSEDRPPSVLHIPEDETSATAWSPSL